MRLIHKGATSQSLYVEVLDSTSTTGARKTGLLFNTAGLTGYYVRNGGSATAITLATLTAANSAYSSGGFKEVDATNMPGVYRLDVPDAAFASGAESVVVTLKGATGMVQVSEEVQLVAIDPQDATAMGVSRIDAAISSRMATFSLPTNFASLAIDVSGRVDLGKWIGAAPAAVTANGYLQAALLRWLTDNAGGTPNALISGRVDSNAQVVGDKTGYTASTVSDKTGYALTAGEHTAIGTDVWDAARSGHVTAGTFGQGVASVQGNVTGSVASLTTNNDKTGYSLSAAGVQAIWDALTSALTTVGSIGKLLVTNIDAAISSRLATSGYTAPLTTTQVENAVWDATASSHTTVGSTGAKLNSAASAGDPLGNAVPGSYAAGTAGNVLGNLVASVWNALTATYTSAGSMGHALGAAGGAADPLTNTVPGTYLAGTAGYALGTLATGIGPIEWTYTLTRADNGQPIAGATIVITSDAAGTVVLAGPLVTNAAGQVTAFLQAGTVYVWRQANGYAFSPNPQSEVVA